MLTVCAGSVTDLPASREARTDVADGYRQSLVRCVERMAVASTSLDLRRHEGVHPRFGSVDVVPFVSLRLDTEGLVTDGPIAEGEAARDVFVAWASESLGLPCFAYGPERSLPEVRRNAFASVAPDAGPGEPHPTLGACAVGARPVLVAYNLWIDADLATARAIARTIRTGELRALGLQTGERVQVSCNLIAPFELGPAEAYDAVTAIAEKAGAVVTGTEVVGLVPERVLRNTPRDRWRQLGLDPGHTIEAALRRIRELPPAT